MIYYGYGYTNYSGYSLFLFYVFIEQRFECFEGSVFAILAFDDGFVIVFLAFWIEGLGECGTASRQQSFAQAVSNDIKPCEHETLFVGLVSSALEQFPKGIAVGLHDGVELVASVPSTSLCRPVLVFVIRRSYFQCFIGE